MLNVNEHAISDLAWAAGFIDGDGVVSVYRRKDRGKEFRVVVRAMNCNRLALDRLRNLFGGTVHPMLKAETAKLRGWKPSFYWAASDRIAERAIRGMMPFLVLKRRQAELALEAQSLIGQTRLNQQHPQVNSLCTILEQMRELNKKGQRPLVVEKGQ